MPENIQTEIKELSIKNHKSILITVILCVVVNSSFGIGPGYASGAFITTEIYDGFHDNLVSKINISDTNIVFDFSAPEKNTITLQNVFPHKYHKKLLELDGASASFQSHRNPAVLMQVLSLQKNNQILLRAGSNTGLNFSILPGIAYHPGKSQNVKPGSPYKPGNLILLINNQQIKVEPGKSVLFRYQNHDWFFYLHKALAATGQNSPNLALETESMIVDWVVLLLK